MITKEQKATALKSAGVASKNTGGAAAQVAVLTERIKQITEHMKANQHDFMARRGLLQMVGKRRRLLRYVADKDSKSYLDLIAKLGIRR